MALSRHYVDRARELLGDSFGAIDKAADRCIARAQVEATLAVAAELHDLNDYFRGTQPSRNGNDAARAQEQRT